MTTSIEWTRGDDGTRGKTWNPIVGCSRVSKGCEHCYAERVAHRGMAPQHRGLTVVGKHGPRWTGEVRFIAEKLDEPLRWKKPCRVFVNSMSDLFHEGVTDEQVLSIYRTMGAAFHHTYQILTKRPERARDVLRRITPTLRAEGRTAPERWRHVWLGVSVEDQATADERIPLLLECPAAVRWVSCEPLLAGVDLSAYLGGSRVGGGDGVPGARGIGSVLDRCEGPRLAPQGVDEGLSVRVGPGARSSEEDTSSRRESVGVAAPRQHDVQACDVRLEGPALEGSGAPRRLDAREWRADTARPGDQSSERERRGQRAEQSRGRDDVTERDPRDSRPRSEAQGAPRVDESPGEDRRDSGDADTRPRRRAVDASVEDRRDVRGLAADGCQHPRSQDLETSAGLSWVVIGGESGPGARPFALEWARSTIRQCRDAGTPCFVKQLGAQPHEGVPPSGAPDDVDMLPMRLRDRKGGDMSEWPEGLRVREYPEVPRA